MNPPIRRADVDAIRTASGAEAAALIGLARLGKTVCIAEAIVAAPTKWDLAWPTLHGWSGNALLDLTLAWESLDAERLQPVPLDVFRHGLRILPGSGSQAEGTAMGCWIQSEDTVLGLLLLWPFRTPDRATLARFRAESEALTLSRRWAETLQRDRDGAASYTAVVHAVDGTVLATVNDAAHPLRQPSVLQAAQRAVEQMRSHQTQSQFTINGWHLRLRRMGDDAVGVRIVPLGPIALPATHVLAPQQRRVASMATKGHTVNDMAQALDIAPQTVRSHLKRVYQQLNASNRVELANLLRNSPFYPLSS